MSDISINAVQFYARLERLVGHWQNARAAYSNADILCVLSGTSSDEQLTYSKATSLHYYLFGIEISDTIMLISKKNVLYIMTSQKKIDILDRNLRDKGNSTIDIKYIVKKSDKDGGKEDNDISMNNLINTIRSSGGKVGIPLKPVPEGAFITSWLDKLEKGLIEKVDASNGLGLLLCVKDEEELDNCKKASVFTNKVLKHGFVSEMEESIDKETKIKHSKLSEKLQAIMQDPTKLGLRVSPDLIESCYDPIIQSGGKYDIKVSAVSNDDHLSADIIVCSLGARYKYYCANVSRTYLVDVPPVVEKTYAILLKLYDHCMEQMVPGNEMKNVYEAAKKYLEDKDKNLVAFLPKSLGFAIGLEFRDSTLVLNGTNTAKFQEGMVFCLSVGFQNVPLTPEDTAKSSASMQKLKVFSLLVGDTMLIQREGVPDVLTKSSKEFSDISYKLDDKGSDEDGDEDDEEEDGDNEANKNKNKKGDADDGVRRSARSKEEKSATEQAAALRGQRQQDIMRKKIEDARRRMEAGDDGAQTVSNEKVAEAVELSVYRSSEEYPRDTHPLQLRVDMEKECLLLPINGQPVPFHISTIKNITAPEGEKTVYMRINFYTSGASLPKEVDKNMQQLIVKHGNQYTFVKEITYRSIGGRNFNTVHQQYLELKKRVRTRQQKVEQEKDLVVQTKLIKIKDQRTPKLVDVTMRPNMSSSRKNTGMLEAHQNGLRFTSSKGEQLDIMYDNVKHCIYQPCDRTTLVLVHFHLKNGIMIGKKKHVDVQFYTEVIDASENLEASKRSSYDPDELDDEQKQREMKKRLNLAFKEFCQKVEKVAAHYDFNLQVDVPFRKSSFEGTCHREMVLVQPTTHCLVNLTENPQFVISLSEVEHVHFERVTYTTKNFDLVFIFKNYDIPPRSILAIDMKYLEVIQDWLNLVEITFTMGQAFKWADVMKSVKDMIADGVFYSDEFDDGETKPPGWLFLELGLGGGGGEEEEEQEEDDSSFSEESDEESEEDSDDSDDSDEYESEDDDSDEYDDESDLSEEGKDWDELERDAKAADKKRSYEEEEDDRPKKKPVRK